MKKRIVIAIILVLGMSFQANSQLTSGEIKGRIWAIDSVETAVGASVYIEINGEKKGMLTDLDGQFRLSSIPAGIYTLYATQMMGKKVFTGVIVKSDQITNMGDFALADSSILTGVTVTGFKDPLIASEPTKFNISHEDIQVSPNKQDPLKIVVTAPGAQLTSDGSGVLIRGSRPESTIYYIDGVKQTTMSKIPGAAIGSIMVYTGGVPAKYGDCTGGVVVLETLSYFDLYNRWKSKNMR